MKLVTGAITLLVAALTVSAKTKDVDVLPSHNILPKNFKPPQVFKNTNLVRNINLEKGYVKETINVVVQNIDQKAQTVYYVPFDAERIGKIGGFAARDKNNAEKGAFKVDLVEYDTLSSTQFYRITLPDPLAPGKEQTLALSYHILSSLIPLPAKIDQGDKQFLTLSFSEYSSSAYATAKQRTKIKFPNTSITDFTGKPEKQGSTYTYGDFKDIPAGAESLASVRYEFTKPVIHASVLERDVEVSHWGGNIAFEERYWLTNQGANLKTPFNRVLWAQAQYYNPPTSAIRELKVPLKVGSMNPYFTDEIGNVSTSRFRSNKREANLELKPRFPLFGGWNFPFKIGWDNDLKGFLRGVANDGYILKVPFLEGPKMGEGISYEKVNLRVILPEGATNVKYETSIPLVATSISSHRTFMDTLGRTALTLSAMNVIDESRDASLIVTYDLPYLARLRKPVTIFAGMLAVFGTAWIIARVDTSIGKKKVQ